MLLETSQSDWKKQVGTAAGQTIVATTDAFGYIKHPYYYEGIT